MRNTEIAKAPASIQELMDRAVQRFRNRTLDKTGNRAYLVNNAVWDTVTTTGLSSSDMLSFVLGQTVVPQDVIDQTRRNLPIEGRDGYSDAEYKDFVFAGNILMEEIKLSRPELAQEEDDRLQSLGFMPKK